MINVSLCSVIVKLSAIIGPSSSPSHVSVKFCDGNIIRSLAVLFAGTTLTAMRDIMKFLMTQRQACHGKQIADDCRPCTMSESVLMERRYNLHLLGLHITTLLRLHDMMTPFILLLVGV
jgi:hypothetical protein